MANTHVTSKPAIEAPAAERTPSEIRQQLEGYRITTAEILYRLPDHPGLLNSFIWQKLDIAPGFPVLRCFLDFWQREIEGPIHSVRVAAKGIVSPVEWRAFNGEWRLH